MAEEIAPSRRGPTPALLDDFLAEPTPPPERRDRRRALSAALTLLYLAALLGAIIVGFGIGRRSEARSANLGGVTNQLAVEEVAWREADVDLYATTLDPSMSTVWRYALLDAFSSEAPLPLRLAAASIELEDADLARVTVTVSLGDSVRTEARTYRVVGRSWARSIGRAGDAPYVHPSAR